MESFLNTASYYLGYGEEIATQQPPQTEEISQFPIDEVFTQAFGELADYNTETDEFEPMENLDTVILALAPSDQGEFSTRILILKSDGSPLINAELDDNLQIQFDTNSHSLNFIMNIGDDEVRAYRFTFQDHDEEIEVERAIGIKLVEATVQVDFANLVKTKAYAAGDEDYIMGAYDCGPQDDYEEEEDFNGNEIDADWEAQEAMDANDPLADSEWVRSAPTQIEDAANTEIEGSKSWNRTYVTRINENGGADLGLFKHSEENNLEYVGKVRIRNTDGVDYQPYKTMAHRQDQQMLFLDEAAPEDICVMDMYRGEVVDHWEAKQGNLVDIAPMSKYAQTSNQQLLKAITTRGQFTIDPRTKDAVVEKYTMKTNPGFTSIATTEQGFWAIGDEKGEIRLGNIMKRAKVKLPGLQQGIRAVDVSANADWVLATLKTYLMLFNVVLDNGKSCFEGRVSAADKPKPHRLCLRKSDMIKFGIRPDSVSFSPAKFDVGENMEESWIITTTGQFLIKWNFKRVKQGYLRDYIISRRSGVVRQGAFRYNRPEDLLVAEEQSVYCASTAGRTN